MPEYDAFFIPEVVAFRKMIRENFLRDRNISSSQIKIHLDKLAALSYLVIMLNSQSMKDEICKTQYYSLINGRHDCLSFIECLRHISISDLVKYYESVMRTTSMQNLKADTLVNCMIALHVIEDGCVPRKGETLGAFHQIKEKKSRVAMNAIGQYIGVGMDIHVRRFMMVVCDYLNPKYNFCLTDNKKTKIVNNEEVEVHASIQKIIDLCGLIPQHIGIHVNDMIGEISQQLQRGGENNDLIDGKVWADYVLDAVSASGEKYEYIVSQWRKVM